MIRKNIIVSALACIAMIATSQIVMAQSSSTKPVVFAHYMPGYSLGSLSGANLSIPSSILGNLDEWPTTMVENSEWFEPYLAAASGHGVASTQMEFTAAQAAGINAFGVMLTEGPLGNTILSNVLTNAVAATKSNPVRIIPEIWCNPWTDNYALYGRSLYAYEKANSAAFLTHNGKPMFVFDIPDSDALCSNAEQQIALNQIQAFLAPWGGLSATYVICYVPYQLNYSESSPLNKAVNCMDVWSSTDDWSALHSVVAPETAQALRKDFAWPVSPAFYQRRSGEFPDEYGNSLGAARYVDAWLNAIALRPSFVDVQTWNDFSEDTTVVPSNAADTTILDLTTYFTEWMNAGAPPPIATETVMLFHQKQLVNAKLSVPAAVVTNASWRHDTPTVDYVDAVTLLKSPAEVTITVGGQSWQEQAPAGMHEFLIYAPTSIPRASSGSVVPNAKSYPVSSAYRTVVTTPSFSASTPDVEIIRNGTVITALQSKEGFLSSGEYQDLTLIGDETTTTQ